MNFNKENTMYADKIFINGIINSIDIKNNIYESMAVKDGIVIALGEYKDTKQLKCNNTEIIDLKYKTVLPGFIDVHSRISEKSIIESDGLSLYNANNPSEYLKLIQTYVDSHPDEEIIYGIGWNNLNFKKESNTPDQYIEVFKGPNKNWLNKINTNKPIILKNSNNNALWLNDEALNYFKIIPNMKVPVGGKIEIDENGELWGILKESAMKIIDLAKISNYNQINYQNKFIRFQNSLHNNGITTISINSSEDVQIPLEIYRLIEKIQKLKLRISCSSTILPEEIINKTIYAQLHELKRNRIIYKTDLFDISIAKFFADGNIEMKTAYLFKPYNNINGGFSESNGVFLWNISELKEAIKMANRLDFNVFIHASGDLACKLAIDGIDYSIKNNVKKEYKNSLINIDLITKYYIRRMRVLNINAIINPLCFFKNRSAVECEKVAMGQERAKRLYSIKSLIDEGICVAGSSIQGSDENHNILKAIECAVIRKLYDSISSRHPCVINMNDDRYLLNSKERLYITDAIKEYTINAAYIIGRENEIGSLETGKKADFIVLDKNIFKVNPLKISNISIEKTYFNGNLVYSN